MSPGSFDQLAREPIFVIGSARSGTTWISDILAAHPLVARIHESWLFTSNNGVGALFTSAHWPARPSGLGNLLERADVVKYVRTTVIQIMSHALQPHHRYLVEKSPNHIYAIPLIQEIFPDALFIHALRDGRDVCVSVRAAAQSWSSDWQKTFGASISATAKAWKAETQLAEANAKQLRHQFLQIRYEDLAANPFENYRRIFDFCGIPYTEQHLEQIYQSTDFKQNYPPDERGFRRGGRVGDWHKRFSLIDALIFNYYAGDRLITLGYEKDRFWLPDIGLRKNNQPQ